MLRGRRLLDGVSHPSAKFVEARDVRDAGVEEVARRGKYLLFVLDDGREMVVHLGMTGQVSIGDDERARGPYVRASWKLDDADGDQHLVFRDVRRFGRIAVVDAGDYVRLPTLHHLGPEPFDPDLDGAELRRRLGASRRHLKTQLLSQRPIAGVGNIYADEAMWLARVNPTWRTITRLESDRLLDALRRVLSDGIEHGGTTLRDYRQVDGGEGGHQRHLRCYGRSGEPCERCGSELVSKVLDARTTTWCRVCQRR